MTRDSSQWFLVSVVVSAGVVAGLQVGKVPPILPDLSGHFRLDMVAAGWVASLFNLCGALFAIFAGRYADRVGLQRFMVSALILLALGGIVEASATSALCLYLGRIVEGVGFVGITVTGPALISRSVAPRDRGFAIGIWGGYMPTGMALALLLMPTLQSAVGWRWSWIVMTGAAFVPVIGFLLLAPRHLTASGATPGGPKRAAPSALLPVLQRAGPWLYGFIFACYTTQWFAIMIWLPTYLTHQLDMTADRAAMTAAGVVAVNAAGTILAAFAMRRGVAPWVLVIIASLAMALSAFGLLSGRELGWLSGSGRIFFAFTFSGLGGLLPAAVLAGGPRHAPSQEDIGTVTGIIMNGSNLGSLAGPPVIAYLVNRLGGWEMSYVGLWAMAGAAIFAACRLAVLEKKGGGIASLSR